MDWNLEDGLCVGGILKLRDSLLCPGAKKSDSIVTTVDQIPAGEEEDGRTGEGSYH